MSIDNQLLIGTLVFAGLGYYILTQAQPETVITEKDKTAAEIVNEFDGSRSECVSSRRMTKRKAKTGLLHPCRKRIAQGSSRCSRYFGRLRKSSKKHELSTRGRQNDSTGTYLSSTQRPGITWTVTNRIRIVT